MTEPTLFAESGFLRLRLDISYDGTNFFGWGKQPDRRTIQSEVESALEKITRVKCETIVAGRTDAGVHATGQVVHVDIPENQPGAVGWDFDELAYKLNRILDEDIRINRASIAPPGFHARFSALARHYSYRIQDNNRAIPPLHRFDTAPWYRLLDIEKMNEASSKLIGEFDFAAFCKFREGGTTLRRLLTFSWERDSAGYVIAEVSADAFCYSMVRNLVGALVCVGEGRFPIDWLITTLNNKERISDSLVFPARGLKLRQVDYPPSEELQERVRATLAKRIEED